MAWMSKATGRLGSASAVTRSGLVQLRRQLLDGVPQLLRLGPQLGQQPAEHGRFLAGRVEMVGDDAADVVDGAGELVLAGVGGRDDDLDLAGESGSERLQRPANGGSHRRKS